MELVKVIESTGVAAIGIHGRYSVHERESHETIVTWPATHIVTWPATHIVTWPATHIVT